jgi:pyruvate kinase
LEKVELSDGLIELRVRETTATEAICTVVHGGPLGEHKGINLPGVAVQAPSLTSKDEADLAFGVAQGVDYVALSFVRRPSDLEELQRRLPHVDNPIKIIAKLEKPEVFTHLPEILRLADGVMIARGDLGVELPLERVPVLQKEIIRQANRAGVLVITATQMLESMIGNPRPTRAEASDVANAVLDGTDVVMLSG